MDQVSSQGTIDRVVNYIEITREPFDLDEFTIILEDGRRYDVPWLEKEQFLRRMGLSIPEIVFDSAFNFNAVLFYPHTGKMEIL